MKFYLTLFSFYLLTSLGNIFGKLGNIFSSSDEDLSANDLNIFNFDHLMSKELQSSFLDAYDKVKQSYPEETLTAPNLIKNAGYSFEEHTVVTIDGYFLTLHRIPCGRKTCDGTKRFPVLCVHGVMGSSSNFILREPGESLGFLLADAGYDVWLANTRGAYYSMEHAVLSPEILNYWDFSFHEKGVYDLPAIIDYILENTGQEKLAYVGHSGGTTLLYVLLSTIPQYNDKISVGFMMSPVVLLKGCRIPYLNLVSKLSRMIKAFHEVMGEGEVMSTIFSLRKVNSMIDHFLILNYALFFKMDLNTLDIKAFNTFLTNARGISIKELLHYNQLYKTGEFKWFDYKKENMLKYNSPNPPVYDLCSVTAPTVLFYSNNDNVIAYKDVYKLEQKLHRAELIMPETNISHVDYIMGQNAKVEVYDVILDMLSSDLNTEIPAKESTDCKEIS